ncbi:hypothetical protein ACFS7Z_05340 [Pontibacter toksunensis]|uniref:Uncharacterized protein n=1 Tax=Pontibacter toksunensis TaxID=1332631 RepID=A0ABW6BS66_9BACT
MSELSNPLFNNEREFLERQKEEYKNALMGDVDHIKSQGQEYGKKAAMAGGVLLAGYLLKRMISGGASKVKSIKAEKKKKKAEKKRAAKAVAPDQRHVIDIPSSTPIIDYDSLMHEQEDEYTISSERTPHAEHIYSTNEHTTHEEGKKKTKQKSKGLTKSGVGKMLTQQAVAFLLIYAGKKLEEYLHSVSENNDIAATPVVEVTEIETTEYIVPKEDAI